MNIKRTPGRPRDPAADSAILQTALDIFIERGIAAVTIEEIAKRAGVGRTTIYRRWRSKEKLLARAIETARDRVAPTRKMLAGVALVDEPSDFARLFIDFGVEMWSRKEMRHLMARLIGAEPDCPQLLSVYWDTYVEPRWKLFIAMLTRMREVGSIPKDTDIEVLAHMIGGAMIYRLLFVPAGGELSRGKIRAYLIRLLRQAGFVVDESRK